MSTNAVPGIGAYLQRWDILGTAGNWQTLAEVTAIDWAGATRVVIETFILNNADDYVNKLQGVLNAQSVTLSINFTQAEFVKLKTDMETRGDVDYQIVLPGGQGLDWSGFVRELPLIINSADVMQGDVVIEINGAADFVTAALTTGDLV